MVVTSASGTPFAANQVRVEHARRVKGGPRHALLPEPVGTTLPAGPTRLSSMSFTQTREDQP